MITLVAFLNAIGILLLLVEELVPKRLAWRKPPMVTEFTPSLHGQGHERGVLFGQKTRLGRACQPRIGLSRVFGGQQPGGRG